MKYLYGLYVPAYPAARWPVSYDRGLHAHIARAVNELVTREL